MWALGEQPTDDAMAERPANHHEKRSLKYVNRGQKKEYALLRLPLRVY